MVPRVPFELELSYFRGREPKTYRHERRATSVGLLLQLWIFIFLTATTAYHRCSWYCMARWIVQPKWTGMPGEMPAIPRLELVTWLEITTIVL